MKLKKEEIIDILQKGDPELYDQLRISSNLDKVAALVLVSVRQGTLASSGNPFIGEAVVRIIDLLSASVAD